MGYFIANLLYNWQSLESICILSSHCITIFIYSVHELIGSIRLTSTKKYYNFNIAFTSHTFKWRDIFCIKWFYVRLRVTCITGVICCYICIKMISLHTIFQLWVKLSRHNIIYNVHVSWNVDKDGICRCLSIAQRRVI